MDRLNRAITEDELKRIEADFYSGVYGDAEVGRLIESVRLLRRVLKILFNRYYCEPLRRVSTCDPIVNSELAYLKELVSMEDA